MKRRSFLPASALAVAAGALFLNSCSTSQTRISEHPDLYQSISLKEQALVNQGQIRIGMSRPAVWLAWGSPDRRIIGNMAVQLRPGFILITPAARTARMNRWTNISGHLYTIRFVILGSRQASRIPASSLLSPTAKR